MNFVGSYGPSERPFVSELGFAFMGYYDLALAVLVLALPGRLPRGRDRTVVIAMGAAFLVRSLSRLFLFDPASLPDCEGCPSNPFAIAPNIAAFETIETISSLAIALLALTVAGICLRRLLVARPLARRVLWPILAAGIVAMLVAAFDAFETAYAMATGDLLLDLAEPWDEVWSWSMFALRLLVPIGFLVGSLRLRMAGGPLVALAVGLGRVPSPVRLQSALGAALGDPGVRLVRRDPDGDGWLTADGRHTAEPTEDAEHAVTMLEHDGRPLAAIEHDPVLREDPALVGSVMAVLRLAVENERLDAALQSQLEEVRASRARLVQAGEDERRRLERDLHDGAQQRLVSVSLALQQARQAADARRHVARASGSAGGCRRRTPGGDQRAARAGPRHPSGPVGTRGPAGGRGRARTSIQRAGRAPRRRPPAAAAVGGVGGLLHGRRVPDQRHEARPGDARDGHDRRRRARGSRSMSRTTASVARTRVAAPACAAWRIGSARSMGGSTFAARWPAAPASGRRSRSHDRDRAGPARRRRR